MRKIFYCTCCGFTGSDEEGQAPSCPRCGQNLVPTGYPADDWHSMTAEQKRTVKEKLSGTYRGADSMEYPQPDALVSSPSSYDKRSSSWERDLHQISEDFHFIKTLILINVIILCFIFFIGIITALAW